MNYTNHKEHCTHEHHHKKDCHCGKDHSLISEKSQQDRCEREEACEDTLEEPLDQSHSCACHHNHEDHHHHHHEGCQCTGNHTETKSEKILQKAKYKFKINKLDCANCAMKVEDAIAKQAYINDVSLSFSTSILMVDTQREDKQQLLKDLNMIANQVEEKVVIETYQKSEVKIANHRQEIFQLIAGFIALFISMLVEEKMGQITTWLYLFTYLIVGYKVLFIAFRNLLKRDLFDENFLMSLATIGAFALGDYKEAVAVMLFYDIGELFQSIAVNRSRRSIGDLMNIHSDYAMVIRDGKEVAVDPDTLLVDDIVVVKAGERICVDGIVIEGESSLDTSALTGESLPKEISVNDEVLAGCLNINGLFKMRVVKVASESTVSRVLELVENAASKKAKIEKFITKFSKIYTPTVVFAAACLIIIPTLIQGYASFGTWLYRGCTFLVISCPCALVI
ncbi:MAG: heavy metal translocating P-type ATPase, partial [Erysipelotrichia bacterium]|nr:heavy metal translocating P-type ATPase [Erysipelotrichia bacterium]